MLTSSVNEETESVEQLISDLSQLIALTEGTVTSFEHRPNSDLSHSLYE